MLKKNDEIELEITGTTHEGSGVGRADGMVVFVPACAEGDMVKALIICVKKQYAVGKLLSVISPAPSRIEPDCPVFLQCGGCAFRHISYERELQIKWERVRDALTKIGRLNIQPEEILGAENIDGYRNKAQLPVGRGADTKAIAGFYATHSHRIVPCGGCRLQQPLLDVIVKAFTDWMDKFNISAYDEQTGKGLLRHIYIRRAESTDQTVVCAVINGNSCPHIQELTETLRAASPEVTGVVLNINKEKTNVILGGKCVTVCGSDRITDDLGGVKYEISPLSFYQINSNQMKRLYALAAEFAALRGAEILLDLYCGAGTIGLFMVGRASKLIGVEVIPEAVEDARRNAKINNVKNARFICDDAGGAAQKLLDAGERPDVVVLDPPRKGCDAITIDVVVKMSPSRIVYVSCDPATLARDLAVFEQKGYNCIRVKPVDMFPRTAHVECCCLLECSIKE